LGVFPRRQDLVLFNFVKGKADGGIVVNQLNLQEFGQVVGATNHLDFHAVHQVLGQCVGGGCNKIQPIRREFGGHHRDDENMPAQTPDFGHPQQHFFVGENVRSPDIVALVVGFGPANHPREEVQGIANRNGLALGFEPLGGNHEGQFFDQIPNNFKGSGPRTHDNPGPQRGQGKRSPRQKGFNVFAGGQVFGEFLGIANPAEVNDLLNAGLFQTLAEKGRADLLHRPKIAALGGHGVDQVIGHLNIFGDGPQAGLVEEIHLDDGQAVPDVFLGVKAVLVPDATNHLMALVQQNRQQTLRDIPRNASEEDFHGAFKMG